MSDRSRYYIFGAFVLGVTLTVALNQRICEQDEHEKNIYQKILSTLKNGNSSNTVEKSSIDAKTTPKKNVENIKEGIEGCIGNTPLIKIKSLSEYTGCDILVKAEVNMHIFSCIRSIPY